VRPGKFPPDIQQGFSILVTAAPSSNLQASYVPIEAEDKNYSDVAVRAILADQKRSFAPGDNFLLNIELENPKNNTINGLSIELVQYRKIALGDPSKHIITVWDVPHLRGFTDGNYHDTLQFTIPDDNRMTPSFYYTPQWSTGDPIALVYMIKLKVRINGLFKDITLKLPISVHSKEMCMISPKEEEAPPPSYDVPIATH